MKALDLEGQKFGRLTAIKKVGNSNGHITWLCECECGKKTIVQATMLKKGRTRSCGCLWVEAISDFNHSERKKEIAKIAKTTHGKKGSRIYRIWCAMKSRCTNSNVPCYKYYGGRGITVCDEWKNDFMSFYNWAMSHGYAENLTIDRIDVDGNYEPSNCRWATMKEQNKNKRRKINGT